MTVLNSPSTLRKRKSATVALACLTVASVTEFVPSIAVGRTVMARDYRQAASVIVLDPLTFGLQINTAQLELQGVLCKAPHTCSLVPNLGTLDPSSIDVVEVLAAEAIANTPGTKIVFGYSQGAQVAGAWLRKRANGPEAPSPDDLSFILIGNPESRYSPPWFGTGARTPTDTQYNVTTVARQYDGFADWPDKQFNVLAVANAAAGMAFMHSDYMDVDLQADSNVTWKDGNTTYVLVPTDLLPILHPLDWVGESELAKQLDSQLRPMIESAYSRPSTQAEVDEYQATLTGGSMESAASAASESAQSVAAIEGRSATQTTTLATIDTDVTASETPSVSNPLPRFVDRVVARARHAIGGGAASSSTVSGTMSRSFAQPADDAASAVDELSQRDGGAWRGGQRQRQASLRNPSATADTVADVPKRVGYSPRQRPHRPERTAHSLAQQRVSAPVKPRAGERSVAGHQARAERKAKATNRD